MAKLGLVLADGRPPPGWRARTVFVNAAFEPPGPPGSRADAGLYRAVATCFGGAAGGAAGEPPPVVAPPAAAASGPGEGGSGGGWPEAAVVGCGASEGPALAAGGRQPSSTPAPPSSLEVFAVKLRQATELSQWPGV